MKKTVNAMRLFFATNGLLVIALVVLAWRDGTISGLAGKITITILAVPVILIIIVLLLTTYEVAEKP